MGLDKPMIAGASSPVGLVEVGTVETSSSFTFTARQFSSSPHGLAVDFTPEVGKTYLIYGNGFVGFGGTQGTDKTSVYFSIKNTKSSSNSVAVKGLTVYELTIKEG